MNSVVFMGCHDKFVWLCPSIKATNTGERQEQGNWWGWCRGARDTLRSPSKFRFALSSQIQLTSGASISQSVFSVQHMNPLTAKREFHLLAIAGDNLEVELNRICRVISFS